MEIYIGDQESLAGFKRLSLSIKTAAKAYEESIDGYRKEKDPVEYSTWRSKYDPVFKKVINTTRKSSTAHFNGPVLCKVALKQWQQGTPTRRHMRLTLFGLLRFCVQKHQFESTQLTQPQQIKI